MTSNFAWTEANTVVFRSAKERPFAERVATIASLPILTGLLNQGCRVRPAAISSRCSHPTQIVHLKFAQSGNFQIQTRDRTGNGMPICTSRGRANEASRARPTTPVSRQREIGQLDGHAPLQSRFVGEDADAGPVGGEGRVRPRIAVVSQGTDKLIDEVWV
jgi:hypothetical protein